MNEVKNTPSDERELEKKRRLTQLSKEVIQIAKGQLLVNLRFLDRALFELKLFETDQVNLATDGRHLIYNAKWILDQYRGKQNSVMRAYMHCLMHCLFRHMFISLAVDRRMWDLACDIAVEAMVQELDLNNLKDEIAWARAEVLKTIKSKVPLLTAEKIYAWFQNSDILDENRRYERWSKLFAIDEHDVWYIRALLEEILGQMAEEGDDGEGDDEGDGKNGQGGSAANHDPELEQMWKDISERMQTDLETFSKKKGDMAGGFVQSLKALNREKCDYTAFLRKFATRCEVMHISPDEFDYVFYTYGLQMYEDMPLIEPLEYREDKRIRDFVIAIDTSGSVQGKIVQDFLQKTYNILKQEETFARKFNLHIIQCDAKVQEDAVIHSQEEFDEYIKTMKLHGFGGTDFRPVFEYVEQLRQEKAFHDLKGLLYFTDGYGTYPAKMTPYQTAFIFLEEDTFIEKEVPPWAIRVILEKDQIIER